VPLHPLLLRPQYQEVHNHDDQNQRHELTIIMPLSPPRPNGMPCAKAGVISINPPGPN
jgi:hypothetical protein